LQGRRSHDPGVLLVIGIVSRAPAGHLQSVFSIQVLGDAVAQAHFQSELIAPLRDGSLDQGRKQQLAQPVPTPHGAHGQCADMSLVQHYPEAPIANDGWVVWATPGPARIASLEHGLFGISEHQVRGGCVEGELLAKCLRRPWRRKHLLLDGLYSRHIRQPHGIQSIRKIGEVHGQSVTLPGERLLHIKRLECIEVIGFTALEPFPG